MVVVTSFQKERSAFKEPGHIVFFSKAMSGAQKEKKQKRNRRGKKKEKKQWE